MGPRLHHDVGSLKSAGSRQSVHLAAGPGDTYRRAAQYIRSVLLSPPYDRPPVIAMDGPADDQGVPLVRQRRRLATILSNLTEDEWASLSRCLGWTVKDVAAHIVGVNAFWQASVSAGLGGRPTRLLEGFDPAATPPLMVDGMRSLAPADVLEMLIQTNDGLFDAIADLDEQGWMTIAESPAGHVPIRIVVQHALWDCWVHERDILLPLGLTPSVEPDEVISCLRYAAALSPAFLVSSGDAISGAFGVEATGPAASFWLQVGDSVDVRDGPAPLDAACVRGEAAELVEALSMRMPLPRSAPPEWRQLLGGLATVFDQAGAVT